MILSTEKSFLKNLVEGSKIFSKNEKTRKSDNMLISDTEIFPKKKRKETSIQSQKI